MDYEQIAKTILENVGGKENILSIHHCITRLRLELRDDSKMNKDAIEKIPVVQGVILKGTQYQIVLGSKVSQVTDALVKLTGISEDAEGSSEQVIRKKMTVGATIVDYITGSVTPIVPAIMSAGILQSLLALVNFFKWIPADSTTYALLAMFAQSGLYFIPIMLAVSASRKLKCNSYLAIVMGGILIAPEFIALVATGNPITFFGLPVAANSYGSSFVPILLTMPLLALVERTLNKFIGGILKPMLVPALSILITAPISLIALAPLANYISGMLAGVVNFLYYNTSVFGAFIIGATSPYIVLTGLHTAIAFPILLQELTTTGGSMYFAILTMANIAVGGAALGVALRTKNKNFKGEALGAGLTGVIGTTEPALFGVLLRVRRSLIACGIASGVGGLLVVMLGIHSNGLAMGGFGGLPIFFGDKFVAFLLVAVGTMILSAALAYFIGFKDIEE